MPSYRDLPVVVTGGAGSIGSQLAEHLRDLGARLIVVDDLSVGRRNAVPEGVPLVAADVADAAAMRNLFLESRPAVVFHLAAHFAHANSLEHPVPDLVTNGVGTLNLLDLSARFGVERFIYASSSCVLAPSAGALPEDAPVGTLETPYAISKHVGEEYARFYADHHGLPVSILRYFNSYGPGDLPGPYRSVIPNFLWLAGQGLPLPITGTGDETRDFTYVSDVCQATLAAAELGREEFELYHIGSGQEVRILDLAERINAVTGNGAGVVHLEARPWDRTSRRQASIELAARRLAFHPQTGLDEGLRLTWAWMNGGMGR